MIVTISRHSLYCADVPLRSCSLTHWVTLSFCNTEVLLYTKP